jgi:hypothetical protein
MSHLGAAPAAPGSVNIRATTVGAALVGATVLFGVAAGHLIAAQQTPAVIGFGLITLPVILWRRPYLAPALIIFAALTVEQFGENLGPSAQNLTAEIPLFHGLGSLRLSPADLLLAGIALLTVAYVKERGTPLVRLSPTLVAIGALLTAVLIGLALGITRNGDVRIAFQETRPYVYLTMTFVMTAALVTNRQAIRAVLWAIVIAGGIKAVQGIYLYLAVRNTFPRPEAVLGHEEALFFGLFILLTASLWLFDVPGRLRMTATALLPLVMAADLANTRRAAWLVLGGGLLLLAAIALRALPSRRHVVLRLGAVALIVSAAYFPAFWNKSGGLAQPARAVRSIVAPSMRDASSDLYRVQEDANLHLNIVEGGLLGKGFGREIEYSLPIADITDIAPIVRHVPHNGVLYVLMRMGVLGGIAMWSLIGVGIIAGCRLALSRDRELAVIGAFLACAMIGYTLEGAVDMGFFFYRIAFVIGTLLGLAEAARRMMPAPERTAP